MSKWTRFVTTPKDDAIAKGCKITKRLHAQLRGKAPRDEKCVDCDRPLYWSDDYIVRGEIWEQAGMKWDSGYLHQSCLEARLGRKLKRADFLMKFVRYTRSGAQVETHPDFPLSPEFLKH